MNAQTKIEAVTMRTPFPAHLVSKLPKETRAQIDARKADKNLMVWKCDICGGAHHKNATHLDYVGHAALTDRLLDVDPEWSWEPVSLDDRGLPAFDHNGGLWIKLTVLGVTRMGYGDADGKAGGNAVKEAIGDALRNAAMRFGAALDLWHKGDLHPEDEDGAQAGQGQSSSTVSPAQLVIDDSQWALIVQLVEQTGTDAAKLCGAYKIGSLKEMTVTQFGDAKAVLEKRLADQTKEPANA